MSARMDREAERIKAWGEARLEFDCNSSCSKINLLKDYWAFHKSSFMHISFFGRLVRYVYNLETIKVGKKNHFLGVSLKDV